MQKVGGEIEKLEKRGARKSWLVQMQDSLQSSTQYSEVIGFTSCSRAKRGENLSEKKRSWQVQVRVGEGFAQFLHPSRWSAGGAVSIVASLTADV